MSRISESERELIDEAERAFLERGTVAHYEDAPFYQRTYQHRKMDVNWYVAHCEQAGGSVLELGCGTGRITLPLAHAGLTVTGVDTMRSMLDVAEERLLKLPRVARERVTLLQADLRDLKLRKRFDTVIAPFNVLMHLYTVDELAETLAGVRKHLKQGGQFVFDVMLPDPSLMARDPGRVYKGRAVKHPNGKRYAYRESFEYDAVRQVMAITIELHNLDDPRDVRVQLLTHRQYFPMELEAVLRQAGFEAVDRYGDFDGEPLTTFAESQVWVCQRSSG